MKYDVIVTDAEDIFELSDLQDNIAPWASHWYAHATSFS